MDAVLALRFAGVVLGAYLFAGVPWSLIIGKVFFHTDLRTKGSGNLGATNTMRVLGWKAALPTALLDVGKGAVPVLAAAIVVPVAAYGALAHQWAMVAATLAAIAGHSYSPYIRFRGGKGVATAGGALIVLMPRVLPILLLTWLLVIALSRMVSLASVFVAIQYPLLALWLYWGQWPLVAISVATGALVVWRHRSNIGRIARGEEPHISLERVRAERARGDS